MDRTTGTYIRQVEGYAAFIPENLPPNPPIEFDDELHTLLSNADRALGRLDGSIEALPNAELFVFMYVRKEAVLSSQIEGTQASLADILEVEAKIFDPNRPSDTEEILNYVTALNYGLNRLETLPISQRLIAEIHFKLMQGVRGQHATPGEFRRTQNWIGPAGATLAQAKFVPPPPHMIANMMGALESYIHADDKVPLLIKLGLVHVQFETLHPFLDGNGRIGRLLIAFLLCERKVLAKPVLYLSHFLKQHRSEYYELLQATRDDGRLEDWLKFFLRGIASVANEAADTARKIVQMRELHRKLLIESLDRGTSNGLKLLESFYQRPIFTVANAVEMLGLSKQAANTLVEKLETLGLITEITGNPRYRMFRYDPYVKLFTD